jgi:hypothetical protein
VKFELGTDEINEIKFDGVLEDGGFKLAEAWKSILVK